MKADKTTMKKFHMEQIAFCTVPQTGDVLIAAINVCQLDISLANTVYCMCTCFSADPSGREGLRQHGW